MGKAEPAGMLSRAVEQSAAGRKAAKAPAAASSPLARETDRIEFGNAIKTYFPAGAATDTLIRDLSALPGAPQNRPLAGAYHTGLALHAVTGGDAQRASALLKTLGDVDGDPVQERNFPLKTRQDLNKLRRELAATPDGMETLWQMESHSRGPQGPGEQERRKGYLHALQISDYLQRSHPGDFVNSPISLDSVGRRASSSLKYNEAIGNAEDHPAQLAYKAFRYADATRKGKPVPQQDLAAYVAWQDGYRTSGKGSNYNKTLNELNRYHDWLQGATKHNERTAGNIARDMGHTAGHLVGAKGNNPLKVLAQNPGMDRGNALIESVRYREELRSAISQLRPRLEDRSRELQAQPEKGKEYLQVLTERALLEEWRANPQQGHQPNLASIKQRVAALDATRTRLSDKEEHAIIRDTAGRNKLQSSKRGDENWRVRPLTEDWLHELAARHFEAPNELQRSSGKTLRETAEKLQSGPQPLSRADAQALGFTQAEQDIRAARTTAHGGVPLPVDSNKTFVAGDLGRIVSGEPPRQGVTEADVYKALRDAQVGPNPAVRATEGRSLAAIPTASVVGDLWFVSPRVGGGANWASEVSPGRIPSGHKWWFGDNRSVSGQFGAVGGVGLLPDPENRIVASIYGTAGATYERSNFRGASLFVPKVGSLADQKDRITRVNDFMHHIVGGADIPGQRNGPAGSLSIERPAPLGKNGKLTSTQVSEAWAREFGTDPHSPSMSWLYTKGSSVGAFGGVGAGIRAGSGEDNPDHGLRVGPLAKVTGKANWSKVNQVDNADGGGRIQTKSYTVGSSRQIAAEAGLKLGTPPFAQSHDNRVGVSPTSLASKSKVVTLKNTNASLRITTDSDGNIIPSGTVIDDVFGTHAPFVDHIRATGSWHKPGTTYKGLDGTTHTGEAALNQFLKECGAKSRSEPNGFRVRRQINEDAAKKLDSLAGLEKRISRSPHLPEAAARNELERIESARQALLADPGNWSPLLAVGMVKRASEEGTGVRLAGMGFGSKSATAGDQWSYLYKV